MKQRAKIKPAVPTGPWKKWCAGCGKKLPAGVHVRCGETMREDVVYRDGYYHSKCWRKKVA